MFQSVVQPLHRNFRRPDVRWLDGFARMRFLPRNLGDLHTVLTRHLPDEMPVEASEGTGISAKTVGELRKLSSWAGGRNIAGLWPPRFENQQGLGSTQLTVFGPLGLNTSVPKSLAVISLFCPERLGRFTISAAGGQTDIAQAPLIQRG